MTNYEEQNIPEIKKLSPDDLDSIAGGRELTRAEKADYDATFSKYQIAYSKLNRQGRGKEAFKLYNTIASETARWKEEIANDPDGSPEKLFSARMEGLWPD